MPRRPTRFALFAVVLLACTPGVLAPRLCAADAPKPAATEGSKDKDKDKDRDNDSGKYEEDEHDSGPVQLGAITAYRLLDIEWQPGPFPGSDIAILAGDPKTGLHTTYLRLPPGTRIPPHWHSCDEYVTVVEGTILFGQGEKIDANAARLFGPGAFLHVPAKVPHYAWSKSQVILSQTRAGAVDFHWVNPDDDPAKATNTKAAEKK